MKNDPLFRPLPDSFEERCPAAVPPPRKPTSWRVSFFAGICFAVLAAILMAIVPKFGDVYRQVKVPMPASTCALLAVSDAACAFRWLVYPALLLLPACLGRLSKTAASRAELALIVGVAACLIWIVVALFLPLVGTLEGIGRQR